MGKVETGDLDKLIEAMESGTAGWYDFLELCEAVWGADCSYGYSENVRDAFCNGSLDAAKRLHDALLPGWRWGCGAGVDMKFAAVSKPGKQPIQAESESAARAWLLAILRALKSLPGNGASNATAARPGSGDA